MCRYKYLDIAYGPEDKQAVLYLWCSSCQDGLPFGLQVDVLYLHNVEESQRGTLGDQAFMDRLKAAFQWLEKARAAGRIQVFPLLATDSVQQVAMQLPLVYCTATLVSASSCRLRTQATMMQSKL